MLNEEIYINRHRNLNYIATEEQLKSINMFHPPHELKVDSKVEANCRHYYYSKSSKKETRVIISKKKQSGILNPSVISLMVLLYLLPNPSIMTFSNTKGKPNNTIEQQINISNQKERSLFGLVGASPAPEPAASRTKTASSGSHRIPPMNGSIFGKRSIDKQDKKSNPNDYNDNLSRLTLSTPSYYIEQQQQQQQQVKPKLQVNKNGESDSKQTIRFKVEKYDTLATNQNLKSVPINYKDIITEVIEDFLASNNESKYTCFFCNFI